MNRRHFIAATAALPLSGLTPSLTRADTAWQKELAQFIRDKAQRDHIPGVAACLIQNNDITWSHSYGFADLERDIPMSLDSLQNIASVSKTFTGTAVMQLVETGLIRLDTDVNEYLPFAIENPSHPGVPITPIQLLTHVSSLRDGRAYPAYYQCGDARISLATWIREYLTPDGEYLTPDGEFYDPESNFHPWRPGSEWAYCNVAYGLLGYLVETVSGIPFYEYCRRNIFAHLEMNTTSWLLTDIDRNQHAVPYTWVEGGRARGRSWDGEAMGVLTADGRTGNQILEDGFQANCLYNHPNYPDGFLRTSVNDISRFLRAYLGGGKFAGRRILQQDSISDMLSVKTRSPKHLRRPVREQGIVWNSSYTIEGELAWGHGGRDPGVNTDIRILPSRNLGAIVFTNTNHINPWEITKRILETAIRL